MNNMTETVTLNLSTYHNLLKAEERARTLVQEAENGGSIMQEVLFSLMRTAQKDKDVTTVIENVLKQRDIALGVATDIGNITLNWEGKRKCLFNYTIPR